MFTNKNFAVTLPSQSNDPKGFAKAALINRLQAKYPWLTIDGVNDPVKYNVFGEEVPGVQYAGPKDIITFGVSEHHDVSWKPSFGRKLVAAPVPVYDIIEDWNTVVNKLDKYATAKRSKGCLGCPFFNKCREDNSYRLSDGRKVSVFDNFVKIGTTIIPRRLNTTTIARLQPEARKTIEAIIVNVTSIRL